MILYDFCFLPAKFRFLIINVRYLESHVQLADRCASWKFTSDAAILGLQALQFQRVGIFRKFPGGASISHLRA
jgi:hypothetical protein